MHVAIIYTVAVPCFKQTQYPFIYISLSCERIKFHYEICEKMLTRKQTLLFV